VTLRIVPSLASAPLDRLGAAVQELEAAGVDALHFDIEDGSFVPVMTLGTKIISDLRPLTALAFDVHLMMLNPSGSSLAAIGIDRLVHYEACPYRRRVLRQIAFLAFPGLAFNRPPCRLSYLHPYLSFLLS
jgi:ribulose-phosphate 3-epimerase